MKALLFALLLLPCAGCASLDRLCFEREGDPPRPRRVERVENECAQLDSEREREAQWLADMLDCLATGT